MKRAHYRKLAGYDKQIELLLPTYGLDQLGIAERCGLCLFVLTLNTTNNNKRSSVAICRMPFYLAPYPGYKILQVSMEAFAQRVMMVLVLPML